jgi:carbon storage regulator CsrA
MLVLARKENQTIVVERDGELLAEIVVVSATGPVRIGIDAPDDVLVLRGEVAGRSGGCGVWRAERV